MLWLVSAKVTPEDPKSRLNLDPARPVCFVLPQRSWSDLFGLDRLCKELGLPLPFRAYMDTAHGAGAGADPQRAVRKLTRALHFHFLRNRTAVLGPNPLRRAVVVRELLATGPVQEAIEREAKHKKQTLEQV